jgi:ABC-type histidine transport system ATPase subunit
MLSISNLHVAIGDKPILKGLTLDVPAGEVSHGKVSARATAVTPWRT